MIILFSAKYFHPIKGGGEQSMLTLLKHLSQNHRIYVLCEGAENEIIKLNQNLIVIHRKQILENLNKFAWIKRYIQNLYWKYLLDKFIPHLNPNIIFTQLMLSLATISIANKYEIPSVLFIRHFYYFCPLGFGSPRNKSCIKKCNACHLVSSIFNGFRLKEICFEFLFIIKLLQWNMQTIQNSDLLISNSQYSAQKIIEYYGKKSDVIYPFIEFEDYKIEKIEKKYITMVSPTEIKGVEIFLRIANQMRDLQFLAVGITSIPIQNKLKKSENVTYVSWVDDIRSIYAKTHILLVPSTEEPFGRVAVEAMLNGIPTIGSNSGGIPEIIPEDLIVENPNSIHEWIQKINFTINNYQFFTDMAKKLASPFNSLNMINKFLEMVKLKFGLII